MSSNYPPGISGSTFGAPWNDIDEDVDFNLNVKVYGCISLQGPISNHYLKEEINDAIINIKSDMIATLMKEYPDFEFEIL